MKGRRVHVSLRQAHLRTVGGVWLERDAVRGAQKWSDTGLAGYLTIHESDVRCVRFVSICFAQRTTLVVNRSFNWSLHIGERSSPLYFADNFLARPG